MDTSDTLRGTQLTRVIVNNTYGANGGELLGAYAYQTRNNAYIGSTQTSYTVPLTFVSITCAMSFHC